VPVALLAGFYAIRFFPAAARAQAKESRPLAAAISKDNAPGIVPAVAKAVTVGVAAETPGVVPNTPAEAPAKTEKPAPGARPRAQFPVPPMRRAGKPAVSNAIRVTGGELQPSAATPATGPISRRPAEASEPLVPKTDFVEAPEAPARPAELETASDLAATSQEAAPEKTQNTGNRFVRALGKVNPFRKRTKHDAGETAKTPLKKD
jgi:hypothetical protein